MGGGNRRGRPRVNSGRALEPGTVPDFNTTRDAGRISHHNEWVVLGRARTPEPSPVTPPLRFSRRFAHTLVGIAALGIAPAIAAQSTSSIPSRLSDRELWQLNSDFSEPSGYFRSDNFLSNETGFQFVIPDLVASIRPGGVYLGVGPEQNFTYIAALKPKIAIIVDIRRGNMIAHLMYKALF